MNPDPKFQTGIAQQIVWKNAEVQRFAVALISRAREAGGHWTTDLVPDAARGDSTGIAGSVVELLKNAGVIVPVGHRDANGQWFALRKKSSRPDRRSAWLCAYRLASAGMADEFLSRHGQPKEVAVQSELMID